MARSNQQLLTLGRNLNRIVKVLNTSLENRKAFRADLIMSNNLTYISRDGHLEIEDQDGQVINKKEALAHLKTEWRDGGMPIAADSTMPDGPPHG